MDDAPPAIDAQAGAGTAICTWFVADDASNATYSPQLGKNSDAPEVQQAYWRCIAVFYASSIAVNPAARPIFFSNVRPPTVSGIDLAALFARWGVEVVALPITWRLSSEAVSAWANQFYIFEILQHLAANPVAKRVLVLDNDVIWLRPVTAMAEAIDRHGALTYLLDDRDYTGDSVINGLSGEGMARFVARHGGPIEPATPYCGGEIYAATQALTVRFAERARALWPDVSSQAADAPREDGHMLSVLYALEHVEIGTAKGFIRRLWTTFHFHNLAANDRDLTLWHLPAEKKTGFADLFAQVTANAAFHPARDGVAMGLTFANYAKIMGYPRRGPVKLLRDLSLKVIEKLRK
ncbi:MAG: hypothetical protein ABIW31_04705 [Novosphingobium sp.]